MEASTRSISVALLEDEQVLAERLDEGGGHHAETLLPAVVAVLAEAGRPLASVEGFAVSIGPGSFTSLRIGLATVKGLAMPADLPVAAVPTLRAHAWQWGGDAPGVAVAALLDARRGERYAAVFGAAGEPRLEEGLYDVEALRRALPAECVLVGDDAALLAELAGPGRRVAAAPLRAASVGRLGRLAFAAGDVQPASVLVPRYVRRAEAEAKRLGQPTEAAAAPGPSLDT